MSRKLTETTRPLHRVLGLFAVIARRARDDQVLGAVGPAEHERHHVVDVAAPTNLGPTPIAPAALALVLNGDVSSSVGTGRSQEAGAAVVLNDAHAVGVQLGVLAGVGGPLCAVGGVVLTPFLAHLLAVSRAETRRGRQDRLGTISAIGGLLGKFFLVVLCVVISAARSLFLAVCGVICESLDAQLLAVVRTIQRVPLFLFLAMRSAVEGVTLPSAFSAISHEPITLPLIWSEVFRVRRELAPALAANLRIHERSIAPSPSRSKVCYV